MTNHFSEDQKTGTRSPGRERLNCRAALWLAKTTIVAVMGILSTVARAQTNNGTWLTNPGSSDFNAPANWGPTTVPTGTAFFGTSSQTSLSFSASSSLGGWTFNSGASNYAFSNNRVVTFTDAGIDIIGGGLSLINNGALVFSNASGAGSPTITNNDSLYFFNTSTAGGAVITNKSSNGTLYFFDNSTAGNAIITNDRNLAFNNTSNAGNATLTNNFSLSFNNTSSAVNATITNNFNLSFNNTSMADNATVTNNFNLSFNDESTANKATITNNQSMAFNNAGNAGSATITNNRSLTFNDSSNAGDATFTNNSSLSFNNTSTAGSATVTNDRGGTTSFTGSSSGGSARFILNGGGTLDISALTTGGTTAGSIEGDGKVLLGAKNLTTGGNNLSTIFSGVIQDGGASGGIGGSLTKTGSGTLALTGTNTYTGATTISGGTLEVDGSIADSSSVTVNSGGTLTGLGVVDPAGTTILSGGTLAPGNASNPTGALTIAGSLAFQPGARYLVHVTSNAPSTNVAGTATLTGGTVDAIFASTTFLPKQYTLLASTGLSGTTFNALSTDNLPPNFIARLSYSADDVFLNLTAALGAGAGLNQNQRGVADAITSFFNGSGMVPPGFSSIFNLSGNALGNALAQLSGEAAIGSQQSAFDFMDAFLGSMTTADTKGGRGATFGALGADSIDADDSFGTQRKYAQAGSGPLARMSTPAPYHVWGAGFGGAERTQGDAGATGSSSVNSHVGGGVVGVDYLAAPDTIVGIALAGGSTGWSVGSSLGTGSSGDLGAGAYALQNFGPAYVTGALAFGEHRITTTRTVTVSGTDVLTASYDGQSYAGRLEAGNHLTFEPGVLTPYAALQPQAFVMPGYREGASSGSSQFALSYESHTATSVRTEIGSWANKESTLGNGSKFDGFARLAWLHDDMSTPALNASLTGLAGSTAFTVDGASPSPDRALITAGAELEVMPRLALMAKADAEVGTKTQSLSGTIRARYTW